MTTKLINRPTIKATQQNRSEVTRKRILKMAAKCLAEQGMQSLRYANIAKLAKVPQALMGYHFPTVDSLLFELVQQELEKLKILSTDRVERYASQPKKALEYFVRAPFDLSASDSEFRAVWTSFHHLAVLNPAFAELNGGIRRLGRDRIVNLVTMVLATEGHLGQNHISREELLEMATIVQGLMTGFCAMAATEASGDYKHFSNLAVDTSFQILGLRGQ